MISAPFTILIVDDQLDNLRTLSALLTGQGYRVRKALSGQTALDTVAVESPDLILLDISMAGMDGYELCRKLKADPCHSDIPVLFLSALDDVQGKLQAFQAGGSDYITKPFATTEVLARIRHQEQILRQQRSLQQEITERHEIEATLARQNQTLTTILQAIPDRILHLRPDGTILGDSWADRGDSWADNSLPAAPTALSSEPSEPSEPTVLAPPWPFTAHDRVVSAVDEALTTGSVVTIEYTNTDQGQIRHQEVRLTAFGDKEVLAVIRDITQQRCLEFNATRQAGRERLLANITEKIHQSLQVQDILEAAVEGVRQLVQVDRVVVYRFNQDWSGEITAESIGRPELSILGEVIYDPCFENKWHLPYLNGRIQGLGDIEASHLKPCYLKMLRRFQVRANLIVPILLQRPETGRKLWGLLIAHHCDGPHPWGTWVKELMQQLAAQLAVALQRAQLYEQLSRQASREVLLNQILDAVRESLDPELILQHTAQAVQTAFNSSRALIVLCQETDEYFQHNVVASAPGVPPLTVKQIPLQGNPHALAILNTNEPIAVESVQNHPLMEPMRLLAQACAIEAMLSIVIRSEGKAQGILCVHQCDGPRHWNDDDKLLLREVADQLAVALRQAELYQQVRDANRTLERLANLDGLTQVANRRRFDNYLAYIWAQQRREQQPLSLVLCDVDYFKRYNDSWGHLKGDDCLKKVAQILTEVINRPADLVARYGGEEFALILPHTPNEGACYLAEQVQTAISIAALPHPDSPISPNLSLSLGVSTLVPDLNSSPVTLITHADAALYIAKDQGRNQFVTLSTQSKEALDTQAQEAQGME